MTNYSLENKAKHIFHGTLMLWSQDINQPRWIVANLYNVIWPDALQEEEKVGDIVKPPLSQTELCTRPHLYHITSRQGLSDAVFKGERKLGNYHSGDNWKRWSKQAIKVID